MKKVDKLENQRISITIQRGNAASIFATVPTSNKLQEIYYLKITP